MPAISYKPGLRPTPLAQEAHALAVEEAWRSKSGGFLCHSEPMPTGDQTGTTPWDVR